MRSPEEVAREVLGCHVETVEPGLSAAGTRYCGEHRYPWLHDADMCPVQERAAALIRARDAEIAEAARTEALAGFAEYFAAAFEAADSRIAIMGHQVLDREYATRQAEEMSSPEDATPSFVARRLVGPWEPVEP